MEQKIVKGVKDTLVPNKEPVAAYDLACQDCKRVREQQMDTNTGNETMSAATARANQERHVMHRNTKVVDKESNTVKRRFRAALVFTQVELQGGSRNRDQGSNFSKIWTDLIVNLQTLNIAWPGIVSVHHVIPTASTHFPQTS